MCWQVSRAASISRAGGPGYCNCISSNYNFKEIPLSVRWLPLILALEKNTAFSILKTSYCPHWLWVIFSRFLFWVENLWNSWETWVTCCHPSHSAIKWHMPQVRVLLPKSRIIFKKFKKSFLFISYSFRFSKFLAHSIQFGCTKWHSNAEYIRVLLFHIIINTITCYSSLE